MNRKIGVTRFCVIVAMVEDALGYDAMRQYLNSSALWRYLDGNARAVFNSIMVAF